MEIERKFLVDPEKLDDLPPGRAMRQGYLDVLGGTTVRARVSPGEATLTIKGPSVDDGRSRPEFEYSIPMEDARYIIDHLCGGRIVEKTRHEVIQKDHVWEIDMFTGANAGLILAEVELDHPDEAVELPVWIESEVTGDWRCSNRSLAEHPWPRTV